MTVVIPAGLLLLFGTSLHVAVEEDCIEVYEDMVEVLLVLEMFLTEDSSASLLAQKECTSSVSDQ